MFQLLADVEESQSKREAVVATSKKELKEIVDKSLPRITSYLTLRTGSATTTNEDVVVDDKEKELDEESFVDPAAPPLDKDATKCLQVFHDLEMDSQDDKKELALAKVVSKPSEENRHKYNPFYENVLDIVCKRKPLPQTFNVGLGPTMDDAASPFQREYKPEFKNIQEVVEAWSNGVSAHACV